MASRMGLWLVTIGWLILAAPMAALAQDASDTAPEGAISIQDAPGTDAAIAAKIRGILREIEDYDMVTVSVTSGVVTLNGTVADGSSVDELGRLVARVEGVATIQNRVTETTDITERLNPVVDRFKDRLDKITGLLPLLLVGMVAFFIVAALGFFLAARQFPWSRIAPNAFIADIYRQLVRVAFVLAGLVIALDIVGAAALLGTILGAAGIIGLAIGFAVRDTVENFIASVMLSIRQPFAPNDFIEIAGDQGNVIRLTSRATILLSPGGNHIRIPNAIVFKSRIVNFSRNQQRRFDFTLGVDADADIAAARDVGVNALLELPFVLQNPAPAGWVQDVGDSNVILFFAGWIDQGETDFAKARGEAIRTAKVALESSGFGLPEPIYRLRFDDSKKAGDIVASTAPATPPAPRPVPQDRPEDVDAEKDKTIERLVNQERSEDQNEDLLSQSAPQE